MLQKQLFKEVVKKKYCISTSGPTFIPLVEVIATQPTMLQGTSAGIPIDLVT
jgi:hypothetical protein